MTRVLLVGCDRDLARRLAAMGDHEVHAVPAPEGLDVDLLAEHDPDMHLDLLFIGPEVPVDQALTLAKVVDASRPFVETVLVAQPDTELVLAAMRAGVRDVLSPGVDDDQLRVLLLRAGEHPREQAFRQAPGAQPATEPPSTPSKVTVVLSPKGGVGKTTTATNLAVGLARVAPMETVLVDLDLQFGDVATALDLAPAHTVADACQPHALRDSLVLKTLLSVHPAGLYVLCAPDSPVAADAIDADQVRQLITQLATQFRHVVVDTAAGVDEHLLGALEVADEAVLVTTMDVAGIRALRKEVHLLTELQLLPAARHLVINNADRHAGLAVRDVEQVVGLPVEVVVPRSREFPLSTNRGEPVLARKRPGAVAKPLHELVARITEVPVKPRRATWAHRRKELA
ncbi:MAG: P-loop NTPase [Nocardioidaceae bacterium]|nr:P-loop NTPase [Nocardioidaceae bacterium]